MSQRVYQGSSSPHIRSPRSTAGMMYDVVLALLPAAIYGVIHFGTNAGMVMAVSVVSAVGAEAICQWLCRRPVTIRDGSAAVTGMLLGMSLPPTTPFWIPMLGSFFAILIVKQLFGGLGHNFVNPALAARAFLLASWPGLMTDWQFPATQAVSSATATTQATPIEALHWGTPPSYLDFLTGNIAGCIGEVCKIALLIGAIYLLARKVIRLYTPVSMLGALFLLTWMFGGESGLFTGDGLYAILSGSAILGAFFMMTDYVTSPVTKWGQALAGAGAGALIFIFRAYGSYPEGVTYAIMLMNILTPLIDKFMRPKVYGEVKARG